MLDYKEHIQAIFENLCMQRHFANYWDLPQDLQFKLYAEAEREYAERAADRADYMRKAERERA